MLFILYAALFLTSIYECATDDSTVQLKNWENAFKMAIKEKERLSASNHKESLQSNTNNNQGLINTIINHHDRLEHIENKVNVVVNNFANSSHVREIVEKQKVLEEHIYGKPVPHASWRDLVLVLLVLVGMALITFNGNKLFKTKCQKRISEHLMKENDTKRKTEIAYIELHLDQISKTLKDLQITVEQNKSSRLEKWSSPIIARDES